MTQNMVAEAGGDQELYNHRDGNSLCCMESYIEMLHLYDCNFGQDILTF
jgi:hypothetical protein